MGLLLIKNVDTVLIVSCSYNIVLLTCKYSDVISYVKSVCNFNSLLKYNTTSSIVYHNNNTYY